METQLSVPKGNEYAIHVPPVTTVITIMGHDGVKLLEIGYDGTVTGDIERSGEAAEVFLRTIRSMIAESATPDWLKRVE